MLRSLTFRTKLMCTLAVPMVALLAITAIAGRDRVDQAGRANRLGDRIGVVAAAVDLDYRVQKELAASANPTDGAGLAERRGAVDSAVARLSDVMGPPRGGTDAYELAAGRVRKNLGVLSVFRSAVDSGSPVTSFAVTYGALSSSLSELAAAIADTAEDPGLARQTAALAALSRLSDATAVEASVLDVAFTRGSFADGEAQVFTTAMEASAQWSGVYQGLAGPEARTDLRNTMVGPMVNTSQTLETEARKGIGATLAGAAGRWREASGARLDLLHDAQSRALSNLSATARGIVRSADDDLRAFAAIAAVAIVAAVGLALLLARTVTRPLRKLTAAARRLADEQLPQLVQGLRTPGPEDQRFLKVALEPIRVRSNDELGQLAGAFNSVQQVAVDVAAEQAELLRKGISDIFVSLARRNQVLIDRQIEFLDELEAAEDDPDQLGSLYRLDHLATRMRRNAESLLVLAGMEPSRRRSKPVPLVDVVRAAIGETEEYARIEIVGFSEIDVIGAAAVDLGHLLAELLENATHYSPPDTRVTVEGRLARSGYVVSIVDAGIGMGSEQLADANSMLASPPPVGLALGRSLGFTVVARLAARHGVAVRLIPAAESGVSAVVHLPAHLIASADDRVDAAPPAATAPLPTPPPGVDLGPAIKTIEPVEPATLVAASAPRFEPEVSEPAPLADEPAFTALDDDEFEATFQRAWGSDAPGSGAAEPLAAIDAADTSGGGNRTEPPAAGDLAGWAGDAWAADDDGWDGAAPEPDGIPWADDDAGASPAVLPRRQPPAPVEFLDDALPTGSAFDRGLSELVNGGEGVGPHSLIEPPVDVPAELSAMPADSPPEPLAEQPAVTAAGLVRRVPKSGGGGLDDEAPSRPAVAANRRTPEEVRAMLAKYRTGLQRGRTSVDGGGTDG